MSASRRAALLLGLALVLAPRAAAMPPSPPQPPSFAAADKGDVKALKALAKAGADLYARDPEGRTLLVRATIRSRKDMIAYLLGQKPDLDARDLFGNSALHYAALAGDDQAAKALLAAGAHPRLYNRHCQSPLDVAAGNGREVLFKKVRAAAASVPVPADGTAEECELGGKLAGFAESFLAYHKRQLRLRGLDDYGAAAESLAYLERHPAQGAPLAPSLLALVTAPMPAAALEYPEADYGIRQGAVATLAKVVKGKAARDAVAAAMLKVVQGGGCSAYKPRACLASKVQECRAGEDSGRYPPWPRDEDEEACFNCLHCEEGTVGHSFKAALAWFEADKEHRAQAAAALDKLREKRILSAREHKRLRAGVQRGKR